MNTLSDILCILMILCLICECSVLAFLFISMLDDNS